MTDVRPVVVFPSATRRGGVERVAWESLRYLGDRYDTTFVGRQLDRDGLPAVRFHQVATPRWASGALMPLGFRRAAAATIGRDALSISHGVNAPPGRVRYVHSLHRAWLRVGKDVRVRGVHIPNAVRYALPRHEVLLGLEWDYFRRHPPEAVVSVSNQLSDDLHELYEVPRDRIRLIPNGYDPVQCNPARRLALREERRAALQVDRDAVVILFLANELHRKGFATVLDALSRLGRPEVEVHVVGRTPLDGYASTIAAKGLQRQVRYHGATDDVGLFHAIADLFVLPTQYETFGIAALEALASGIGVIITRNTPGAGELIVHDSNGALLDDPTDGEELSHAFQLALSNDRVTVWGQEAARSVRGFDWGSQMAKLDALLTEIA